MSGRSRLYMKDIIESIPYLPRDAGDDDGYKQILIYVNGDCRGGLDGIKENSDVAHPKHYQSSTGLEAIDVIKAFTSDLKGIEATDTGNILKYMCRWKKKNGLQDLEKAKWYLEHLIENVKENKDEK